MSTLAVGLRRSIPTIVYSLLIIAALLLGGCAAPGEDGSPVPVQAEPAPAATPEPTAEENTRSSDGAEQPAVAEPAVGELAPWADAFAAVVEGELTAEGIPGAALAVVGRDGPLLLRGYGLRDVEQNLPVDPDTLFHIGSTHKSMTALLVALLVDEGALAWDTPAVAIDPDFALADENATESVTISHLLSMTSGISEDAEDELPEGETIADVFAVAAESELLGAPGEVFSYSNISAALAGYLTALAAGSDFESVGAGYVALLQERILDPLGMETATVSPDAARQTGNYSLTYDISGGAPEMTESEDRGEEDALAPSGVLKASAREMALYMQMLVNRGVAPDGTRLVSEAGLEEMWRPRLEDYGLGWEIVETDGMRLVSHTGAYDGFTSVIGLLPEEGVGFVLLVNEEEAGGALTEAAAKEFVRNYGQ